MTGPCTWKTHLDINSRNPVSSKAFKIFVVKRSLSSTIRLPKPTVKHISCSSTLRDTWFKPLVSLSGSRQMDSLLICNVYTYCAYQAASQSTLSIIWRSVLHLNRASMHLQVCLWHARMHIEANVIRHGYVFLHATDSGLNFRYLRL